MILAVGESVFLQHSIVNFKTAFSVARAKNHKWDIRNKAKTARAISMSFVAHLQIAVTYSYLSHYLLCYLYSCSWELVFSPWNGMLFPLYCSISSLL